MKTIEIKVTKVVSETKTVEITDSTQVPGWMSSGTCPVCGWGLHENPIGRGDTPTITAAKRKDGGVYFIHNDCFNR